MATMAERIDGTVRDLEAMGRAQERDFFAEALAIAEGRTMLLAQGEHVLALWAMFQAERLARIAGEAAERSWGYEDLRREIGGANGSL